MKIDFKYIVVFLCCALIGISVDIVECKIGFSENDFWTESIFQFVSIIFSVCMLNLVANKMFVINDLECKSRRNKKERTNFLYFIQAFLFFLYFQSVIYFTLVTVFICYVQCFHTMTINKTSS